MKDKLRELAERLAARIGSQPCTSISSKEVCEFLTILDAEGDGGADESAVPTLHVRCEVHAEDGISGSTYLNVVRVEVEDDGSFTAVTDHWPNPPVQPAQAVQEKQA